MSCIEMSWHEQTIVSVGYLVLMPLIRLQRLYLSPQRLTALASIHNLPFFLLGFHVCPILFVLLNLRLLPLYSLSVLSQLLLWFFQSFHIYLPFTVSTFIHDPFVSVLSYWHLNVTQSFHCLSFSIPVLISASLMFLLLYVMFPPWYLFLSCCFHVLPFSCWCTRLSRTFYFLDKILGPGVGFTDKILDRR